MKLKSKLIATIVSMCAAIAVMGVGVWASTAQSFSLTVNNDVDVKIIGVNADIYGEFAVYSQFTGHTTASETNTFAAKYGATAVDGYTSRVGYDHGYLLYAQNIGVNDGKRNTYDPTTGTYGGNDSEGAALGYGYDKYINETKNNVYLASSNGTLVNNNTSPEGTQNLRTGTATQSYEDIYNVDFTTHQAQVTYLYTINQWAETSGNNAIYTDISINLSSDLIEAINGTVKNGANAQFRPYVYVGKVGEGWYQQNMTVASNVATTKFKIPSDAEYDQVYYVLLTFTFARNNANLDLSSLKDALNHSIEFKAEVSDTYNSYKAAGQGSSVFMYTATANDTAQNGGCKITGASWNIDASKTTDISTQISGVAYSDERLKNCFALETEDTTASHLPNGFLYTGTDAEDSTPHASAWTWLIDLNQGKRTASFGNGFDATGNGD